MATEADTPIEGDAREILPVDAQDAAHKAPVKRSWRRKYRKMRLKFEETMNTSNNLIRDECKAIAVARRLQEQNDQILEALLDLNEMTRLPANLRFDLRDLSETGSHLTLPESEARADALQRRLQELRNDMVNGLITPEDFAQKSDQLHTQSIIPTRSLADLEAKVPHTTHPPDPLPEGLLIGENAPSYMSPAHEEEYLLAMDQAIADPSIYDPDAHDGRPLRLPQTRHHIPTEKELSIQNPDSVYNWLRKHQPQVFLQDKDVAHAETVSEKSSARPATTSGRKRHSHVSGATPGLKNEEIDEELGFIPEMVTTSGRGKRGHKGEDDGAYRPKGSGRGSKRKREDGETSNRGGRKKRQSAASAVV
ncbi:uncharacterized protein EI97DRAFT_466886 [Westerdykella ornata]|uniref:IEC3 subunit of the Ino80 complex, chromatin re-modelling-domain-containing protein n=1 Tax=Westerdykella ornata TaxID=318751 RepID=A0A6A6JKH1_WESOR|nr:uncharacterized protein EI97DRAFT_466886 [Westerdykella ornata]KAF2276754.1 hypothetical protein EI97DRAFT_466886 [Westerdykella ornata]